MAQVPNKESADAAVLRMSGTGLGLGLGVCPGTGSRGSDQAIAATNVVMRMMTFTFLSRSGVREGILRWPTTAAFCRGPYLAAPLRLARWLGFGSWASLVTRGAVGADRDVVAACDGAFNLLTLTFFAMPEVALRGKCSLFQASASSGRSTSCRRMPASGLSPGSGRV